MAVIHTGGGSGEQQHAFHKSPDTNGQSGQATGENTANQGYQKLNDPSGGKPQIEIVDSQAAQDDSQKPGG